MIPGCSEQEATKVSNFDRRAMLESLADGLIIPNFQTLDTSFDELSSAIQSFTGSPSQENLDAVRESWEAAVTNYQHCSVFGFGPGSLPLGPLSTVLGVFPVDENQVELNIQNPAFNLPASFDRDVRGFFTIEYLIYGNGSSDDEIIAGFTSARKSYLLLVSEEISLTIDDILKNWTTTYRDEFINSDGTSAGSSVSLLFNAFVKDYENLKNFKVELPAGLTAGQSGPDPTLVEAYYSGISSELLSAHYESTKNTWFGRTRQSQDLIGFEEYLGAVVGGQALIDQTKEALLDIDNELRDLPSDPLSSQVTSANLHPLRDLLQANTANFKSSMSSLLGISITFNSGDGD